MTKRKNVVSKMLLLVLILTLISCCFLGSTFARYTSSGSGTGTLQVAKWDVSIEKEGDVSGDQTTLNFDKLSPAKEAYDTETQTVRTHSTGRKLIATITYTLDVNATFTFTVTDLEFKNSENGEVAYGESGYSDEILRQVFTIKFYNAVSGGDELTMDENAYTTTLSATDEEKTLNIYAEIIWTSDTEGVTGEAADKRDTWIGANVTTVSCTFGYTAVQATELPNA